MITKNIIGFDQSAKGDQSLQGFNPAEQVALQGDFVAATSEEVNLAVEKAWAAWQTYRHFSGAKKATFLRAIAEEIEALGEALVERVMAESGLPEGRVKGERGRTCNQLRLFATLVEEGHWVEATMDTEGTDIRKMLQALGPVVVFTASNFPLAFSTAGGDTASALASGCPVIVKGHESHPGTNAMVSTAIQSAAQKTGMPDGVFSSLHAIGYATGQQLVQHPKVKAVAFTGSLKGGMAIHQLARERKEPIPVFAEMGSTNPIFILPQKMKAQAQKLAQQVALSVNMGAGQFCTNPGMLVTIDNDNSQEFLLQLKSDFTQLPIQTMLNNGIYNNYQNLKEACLQKNVVVAEAQQSEGKIGQSLPALASVTAKDFIENENLHHEIFGPFTLLIKCADRAEMLAVANSLQGQLTTTMMGTDEELSAWKDLFDVLQTKAGRVIFNGVPTGVAVCHSMQHGGPFPATTDGRFTSVGTSAIKRFARPIAFQSCPDDLLPAALKTDNGLKLWRLVDGKWTQA